MKTFAVAAVYVLAMAPPASAAVDITGQSATAVFDSRTLVTMISQFTNPATVGAGTEFTGRFIDVFGQNWGIALDLFASGFSLGFSEATRNGDGNSSGLASVFTLDISGLSGLQRPHLVSYTCVSAGISCLSGSAINSLQGDTSSVALGLRALQDGAAYRFEFGVASIPEPASWAMLIAGFGLTGAAFRRRRARATA
jgi:hypothetical protein